MYQPHANRFSLRSAGRSSSSTLTGLHVGKRLSGAAMALFGRPLEPLPRLGAVILLTEQAAPVPVPENESSAGAASLRSSVEPLGCLIVILFHTKPVTIQHPDIELGQGTSLPRIPARTFPPVVTSRTWSNDHP